MVYVCTGLLGKQGRVNISVDTRLYKPNTFNRNYGLKKSITQYLLFNFFDLKQSIFIKDNYIFIYPCCENDVHQDACEKSYILPYTIFTHLSSALHTPPPPT